MRRIRHLLGSLEIDEEGTSLTEFTIAMPIFVMVLSFVYHLGAAGHVLTLESHHAQQQMWNDVMDLNKELEGPVVFSEPDQPHRHPEAASTMDDNHLTMHGVRQPRREGLRMELENHEFGAALQLQNGGHWGLAHWRTRPAADVVSLANNVHQLPISSAVDQATGLPEDVVGASPYARALVDDSLAGQEIQLGTGGSGALAPLGMAGFPSQSVPPALGAGVRYGAIHGVVDGEIEFPVGWTLPVRIHFDVMAPPLPLTHDEHEPQAITRRQLEFYDPYTNLLGIQEQENMMFEPSMGVSDWPPDQ